MLGEQTELQVLRDICALQVLRETRLAFAISHAVSQLEFVLNFFFCADRVWAVLLGVCSSACGWYTRWRADRSSRLIRERTP